MKNTLFAIVLWVATFVTPSFLPRVVYGVASPKNDTFELVDSAINCRIEGNIYISDLKEGKKFYDNDLSPLLKMCRKTCLKIEQVEKGTYIISSFEYGAFKGQPSIEQDMVVYTGKAFRLFVQGKRFQKALRKHKVLFVTVKQLDLSIFKVNYKG